MSKKKFIIFISVTVLIPVLVHLIVNNASIQGREISDEEIEEMSVQFIADSEKLLANYGVGAIVMDKSQWPDSIKKISPLTVSVMREGLQIKTKSSISKEWGILVTRSYVNQNLDSLKIPTYGKISERIYRYCIDLSSGDF